MEGQCGLHNNFPPGRDESKGKETKTDFYFADFDPDKWETFKAMMWFLFSPLCECRCFAPLWKNKKKLCMDDLHFVPAWTSAWGVGLQHCCEQDWEAGGSSSWDTSAWGWSRGSWSLDTSAWGWGRAGSASWAAQESPNVVLVPRKQTDEDQDPRRKQLDQIKNEGEEKTIEDNHERNLAQARR